ncbi:uncharacterized mitochondrial protein AtMg00820-like [Solanum tuberosum]|uniref:uncharacterized mitochondrial protein AtMg00820-like n=1 Tax=Solanum tuberosum TaxID=4113 RepID=UPI00073A0BB8|nr:PREDICTED: uncharacterized mitochondrial protein AtMg00820-like [Solanum tuberosum]
MQTRSKTRNLVAFSAFILTIENKNVKETLKDADWVNSMQEELHQFERSKVWHVVPRPTHRTIIGTKWLFRNKHNENGVITRNKSRLVVQGYNQDEGINYAETFSPIARMEAIRILFFFCGPHGIQALPNRCQKCLLKWRPEGRSVCETTTWL